MKKTFEVHFDKIFNITSEIIKNRLCLFYGNYIDEIFDEKSSQFILCFEFLLKALLDYDKFQGTSYMVKNLKEIKFNIF